MKEEKQEIIKQAENLIFPIMTSVVLRYPIVVKIPKCEVEPFKKSLSRFLDRKMSELLKKYDKPKKAQ